MWKTLTCAVLVLAGAVAVPAAAHAQPAPNDAKLAEELAQQAFDAYQKGDFAAAIALYKKAYQSSAAGVILFNIANIYDKKLKDKEQAFDYYRKYLRSGDTEPELVKRASERIDTVRAEIEAGKRTQEEERNAAAGGSNPNGSGTVAPGTVVLPPPPPPPDPPRTATQKLGLAAGGVGLATLAGGGLFAYLARSKNKDAAGSCNDRVCQDDAGLQAVKDARKWANLSTGFVIAGAALITTGVVLYIYGPSKKEDRMNGTTVGIIPQLDGLAITGAW
jgi:tetratricopeptide (TPR) repeat protein